MKKILSFILLYVSIHVFCQDPIASSKMELFGDHIFIQLSVDGSRPLDFVFDTGDGLPVIDVDVANELGLNMDHASSKTSAQGAVQGALIDHNIIEMSGKALERDIQLYATKLRHLEMSIGKNIDGIIGYDLLHHYVVRLDYDRGMFELYDPKTYEYSGNGTAVYFKLDSYIPHVTGRVTLNDGSMMEGEFFLNTGARTTLDFNTKYSVKNQIVAKTGDHFSYPVAGLGKTETLHYEGRVKSFSFGGVTFNQMPVGISTAKHGIQNHKKVAGILGNKVLKRFNLVFNYPQGKVYIEKSKKFDDFFEVNASGIYLQLSEDMSKMLIHRVYEGGPADKAGIKPNTEIISVNGKVAADYTLPQLRELLRKANTSVEMMISEDGKKRSITLQLAALI